MIKKIIYISLSIMLLIFTFTFTFNNNKVSALPPSHENQVVNMNNWSSSHLYDDVYMFFSGDYEIQADTTHLEIYLPQNSNLVQIYKNVSSYINLYNNNDVLIDTIPITNSLHDTPVDGTHTYPLYASSISLLGDWSYFNIGIVHKGVPTSQVAISLNDYSTYRTLREYLAHTGNINWYSYHYYDSYYGIRTDITLIEGWTTITVILPISSYHTATIGNINASIALRDENDNILWDDDLALNGVLYGFRGDTPIITIDLTNELMDIPDLDYHKLTIMIPQLVSSPLNTSYLINLNRDTEVYYNANVSYWVAYVKDIVVDTGRFNNYFYAPSAGFVSIYLNENEVLSHWVDINGNTVATVRYDSDDNERLMFIMPTRDMYVDPEATYVHIYAVIETRYTPPPINIPPPNINIPTPIYNVLGSIGFNNEIGYIIIYTVIVLLLTILLGVIKVPVLAIIISLIILTGYFTYLGMFSVPIIFILFFVYIALFIVFVRGDL